MNIADRIREERKAKGMTQEELADRLGVSRQTIYKWENEMSYPDITNINNLCDIFDVTSDYLIRGIEDKKQARQIDAMIFAIIALGIDILALIIMTIKASMYPIGVSVLIRLPYIVPFVISHIIYLVGTRIADKKTVINAKKIYYTISVWIYFYWLYIIIYGFLCSDVVYSMTTGIDVNNIIPVFPDIPDQHNARWLAFRDMIVTYTNGFYIAYFGSCIISMIVVYRDKIRSLFKR